MDIETHRHARRTMRYHFPPFSLDPAHASLTREGRQVPLRNKALDILAYLVEHHGQLVTHAELERAIWPDRDPVRSYRDTARHHLADIRKHLHDRSSAPQFIENVRGRGYRFIGAVT